MNNIDYDIIILGRGPAGLQAAIHAARAKVSVLVLGRPEASSLYGAHIENYCCISEISGDELLSQGRSQAEKFGATLIEEDCLEIVKENSDFSIKTESGQVLKCRAVIFTLGVSRNKLNIKGENKLKGHGISYCVDCDANFFKNKPVLVVGSGSAAVTGAMTLLSYTDNVSLVAKKLDISDALDQQLRNSSIHMYENVDIKEVIGDSHVEKVLLDNGIELDVSGVFIELGAKGAIELAGFIGVEMDSTLRHIATNKKQETNIPGVYAAGDICGPPWQVAKAIGEGCVAGLEAAAYVKKIRKI